MTTNPHQSPHLGPPFHLSLEGLLSQGGLQALAVPHGVRGCGARPLPWVKATGLPPTRERKAAHYLRIFNHNKPFRREMPEVTLAKVVCNLRNYYQQDADMTVRLIQDLYNPRCGFLWTKEGIRLAWDLVESFTPSLGLSDEMALAKQRAALLENEVVDLIAWTVPGGRVLDHDLLAVFREWNPEIEVTSNAFTRAVQAVTGLRKLASDSSRYWVGFHLPTAEERKDLEAA